MIRPSGSTSTTRSASAIVDWRVEELGQLERYLHGEPFVSTDWGDFEPAVLDSSSHDMTYRHEGRTGPDGTLAASAGSD